MKHTISELEDIASQVRRDVLRMVHAVQSGHPGASLGCADFFTALYFEVLNHNPKFSMEGVGEDLFFLSNGHISPVWYSVLARSGYFEVSELATFRKLDSRLQGHPTTHEGLPGVRIASGSLGRSIILDFNTTDDKIQISSGNSYSLTQFRNDFNNGSFTINGNGHDVILTFGGNSATALEIDNITTINGSMTIDHFITSIGGSAHLIFG